MPLLYVTTLATAGNVTTNSSANTETDVFFLKAGSTRNAQLRSVNVGGMSTGATSLTGIGFRMVKWGTASTGGTGMTPSPVDPGYQAAKATSASAPTAGSTRTQFHVFTCSITGPGGFRADDLDSVPTLEAAGAFSIDMLSVSGGTSLPFTFSFCHGE